MPKMTVSKSEATDLLVAVGLVIASKWDAEKTASKLSAFDKMAGIQDKLSGLSDERLQKLGKKVLKAISQQVSIVVSDGTESSSSAEEQETPVATIEKKSGKPTKPEKPSGKPEKPTKPAAEKAEKPTKEKKPAKEKAEKDPWGTRVGTRTARINAVLLTGKPYTSKEIEEKADARAIHSHLSKLMAANKIERTADGKYQLVGPKPEKVKKAKK